MEVLLNDAINYT